MKTRFPFPVVAGFEAVFRPFLRSRVEPVLLPHPILPDPGLPVLFAANHSTWWDGFLVRELQRSMRPRSELRSIMLERELAPRPLFRLLGCHGLEPGSPASFRRILSEIGALARVKPAPCVSFFPQGRIWPPQRRPLGFHPGIAALAAAMAPVEVVPVAIRMEALNRQKPVVFVAACAPLRVEPASRPDLRAIEASVESRLDSVDRHLLLHGEDSLLRIAELEP